ncbi:hypothetical protein AB1Y20_007920 [Prymnesium parvum]|uniref:Septum-promoting GTP-binding protein 1 n=1 Tax=Prymnesium parvum TaxID=97485 RepID=A0AB34IUV7_PRYPA
MFGLRRKVKSSKTVIAIPSAALRSPAPLIKVALIGDSQVGKTSLMVRYAEGAFEAHQSETQGVNFMERTVSMQGHELTFSIWDIGGHEDNSSMLPLVCNDAAAILFMFDLTRHETLDSIREWHRKARALNKCALPVLVGVKYDLLVEMPASVHAHIEWMARCFADAIDAPLVLCAPSVPINVASIFKVVLVRLFGLPPSVEQITGEGEPLLLYQSDGMAEHNPPASFSPSPSACSTPRAHHSLAASLSSTPRLPPPPRARSDGGVLRQSSPRGARTTPRAQSHGRQRGGSWARSFSRCPSAVPLPAPSPHAIECEVQARSSAGESSRDCEPRTSGPRAVSPPPAASPPVAASAWRAEDARRCEGGGGEPRASGSAGPSKLAECDRVIRSRSNTLNSMGALSDVSELSDSGLDTSSGAPEHMAPSADFQYLDDLDLSGDSPISSFSYRHTAASRYTFSSRDTSVLFSV